MTPLRTNLLTAVLTAAMALPMSVLYAVGALGPQILATFDVSRSALGVLPAAAFGTAAVLSLWSGGVVDRIGPRTALLALFGVSASAFVLMGVTSAYVALVGAMAVSGLAQALANPATNRAITDHIAPARRGTVVGIKQAGVQLAALLVGLGVPVLTGVFGWRAVLLAGAPAAVAAAVVAAVLVPSSSRSAAGPAAWRPARPNGYLSTLMLFQYGLGCALSVVTTFVPLYGHQRLGQPAGVAAVLIAAFGVAGIASRVVWSARANRQPLLSPLMRALALGAAASALLIYASDLLGTVALWAGTVGVGATAVGANAVAMVIVVRDRRVGPIGHASALLSLGFFAGFVVGPTLLGAVADGVGFGAMWLAVAAHFLLAAVVAGAVRRRESLAPSTTVVPVAAGR